MLKPRLRQRLMRLPPLAKGAAVAAIAAATTAGCGSPQPPPAATVTTVAVNTGVDPVYDMSFGPDGSLYYPDAGAIRRLAPGGQITVLPGTERLLSKPSAVQIAVDGTVYVADRQNHVVRAFASGAWNTVCGSGQVSTPPDPSVYDNALASPCAATALALAPSGRLYINVTATARGTQIGGDETQSIVIRGPRGKLRLFAASLPGASGLALDRAGNLYVADRKNNRVNLINAQGVISTVAGTGTRGHAGDGGPAVRAELDGPVGVAVDDRGNLYISDSSGNRIRKVDSRGVISTVAGTGRPGYSGDGGAPVRAAFSSPEALAVDHAGNLYVDDILNRRIRKIAFRS